MLQRPVELTGDRLITRLSLNYGTSFTRHSLFGPLPVSYVAMVRLQQHDLRFPPVDQASPEGLLAVGGDLRPERLLEAYRHGIFPWYNEDQPILWWSPDPRAVLFPDKLHVPRSLKRSLRPNVFTVTLDTSFCDVMEQCAGPRPQYPGGGTWITGDMLDAYTRLHDLGYAHSVETWQDDQLVGGLYGVALGAPSLPSPCLRRSMMRPRCRSSGWSDSFRLGTFVSSIANSPLPTLLDSARKRFHARNSPAF